MTRIAFWFFLFTVIVIWCGCAPTGQLAKIEAQTSRTQEMMDTNRSETRAELSAIKSDIQGLAARLDHISKTQADLLSALDEFQTTLLGFSQTISELKRIYEPGSTTVRSRSFPPAPSETPSEESEMEQGPEHIYQTAINDYTNQKYDLAIIEFQQFLATFPDSELADNAQYWIGECYYSQRKFEEALKEFEKVMTNYPQGDKINDAFLKKGLCYLEMGNYEMARSVLEDLRNRYPYSREARIAEERLKEIEQTQ